MRALANLFDLQSQSSDAYFSVLVRSDLIKAYRACTTRSEERALVKKEAAHIRDLFREGDKQYRRRNISKLLFFHMNGYPTDFGMTECIKLCASKNYSDKRVAYLGLMILVDETAEVLMLMTNCLQQDLHSKDLQTVSLALNVLGDIASVEMVRDLMPEIEIHLEAQDPYIRKKAALAAVRAVKKLEPEETSQFVIIAPGVFQVNSPAVYISGAALVSALCNQSRSNVSELQATMTPVLLNILQEHLLQPKKRGANSAYSDTVIGGVRNPFLQVKLLTALRMLIEPGIHSSMTESISDVLAHVAANTDGKKVAGCAVLYECVRTIIPLKAEKPLRSMAVNILGKFLDHKESTVRYIALQELIAVVDADGPHVLDSIEGYKDKILAGLREADPTVRKRAVELVYRIANDSNMKQMVTELLSYLEKSSAPALIEDACWKIFLIMDRLDAPYEWRVETFVKALSIADTLMPEELITSFTAMVSSHPEIRHHAVLKLFDASLRPCLRKNGNNLMDGTSAHVQVGDKNSEDGKLYKRKPRLERLALYMLGEYGEVSPQVGLDIPLVLDAFEHMLQESEVVEESWASSWSPAMSLENKGLGEIAITGLVKFACRSLCGSSAGSVGSGQPLAITSGANYSDRTALSSILAIADAPERQSEKTDTGLGLDLLDSLGLEDGIGSGSGVGAGANALVPLSDFSAPTGNADLGSLISMDSNDGSAGNPVVHRIRQILYARKNSLDLEVQQRACEYLALLKDEQYATLAAAMSPMPILDFRAVQERARQRKELRSTKTQTFAKEQGGDSGLLLDLLGDSEDTSSNLRLPAPSGGELLALPPTMPSNSEASALSNVQTQTLDDIMGGDLPGFAPISVPNGTSNRGAANPPNTVTGLDSIVDASAALTLEDLMGGTSETIVQQPIVQNRPSEIEPSSGESRIENLGDSKAAETESSLDKGNEVLLKTIITESEDLTISAEFFKENAEDPTNLRVELTFANRSEMVMNNFVFSLAVPKYISLQMHPASGSDIGAGNIATQSVNLVNSMHGRKPVQLRYRVEYVYSESGQMVQDQGVVSGLNLPL